MAADVDNDDGSTSGSSTRIPDSYPTNRRRGSSNIFMSPFRSSDRGDRYPLRLTPERERRSGLLANEIAEEQSAAEELQRMRERQLALLTSVESS
jgi:hypothetical protein